MQMKVVDTNGDGKNEFIVETETWYGEGMMGDPYSISGISVFSHDKELIWHSPDFSTNFLIGDINGNNLPEIICSTRDNKANSIELLEWDGNTYQKKWTFEANLSPLSIVNLEDGKKEVMAIGNSDLFLIFSEERK